MSTSIDESANAVVRLSLPLKFQQELFAQLRAENELVILARGLGLLRLVTNFLHTYDVAGNGFVLVVGASDLENEWIGEALAEHHAISRSSNSRGLKVINTDNATVKLRQKMYAQGGVFSVTSRILVVDFLAKILNPESVTGLIILHAERVTPEALEAFIIRVYRQFNKVGFLKAFSDVPETFTMGFNPLANRLHSLFLRRVSLWPRFQVAVAESMEGHRKAEVIELEVPFTEKMKDIQNAVLECVSANIGELKRANVGLDVGDWTVESALHRNFDTAIRRQLDPVWHRVSFRTRQIAGDLTVLRSILHALLTYDCVSLMKYLDTILAAHSVPPGSTRHTQSPWLFMDAAHILFQTAKERVYHGTIGRRSEANTGVIPRTLQPVLEEQPKWRVLTEVLGEIETEKQLNPVAKGSSNGTVLIMCSDLRTCHQLREYLETMQTRCSNTVSTRENHDGNAHENERPGEPSAQCMLRRNLCEYLFWRRKYSTANKNLNEEPMKAKAETSGANTSTASDFTPLTTNNQQNQARGGLNKRRRVRGGGSNMSVTPTAKAPSDSVRPDDSNLEQETMLLQTMQSSEDADQAEEITETKEATEQGGDFGAVVDEHEDLEDYYELCDMDDLVVVYPYKGDSDERILEETNPQYIIMYEPDPAFIRRVEVYRSSHTARNVRVYFMYYGSSVEEQRYLSSVRREKDAFTQLIKEKGSLVLTLTHEKGANDPEEQFLRTVNTRIAGGGRLTTTSVLPTVVVDVREFRSALPSLLHGKSMVVVPCQLTVGDYILTPDIAVERKSVRDLFSSFRNGRLYNQAETLLQYYRSPALLIEFYQNKSFTFDAFTNMPIPSAAAASGPGGTLTSNFLQASNPRSPQHLLTILALAFPRLKIIWSSSPYQTAEIFEELKNHNPEPDPIRAVQVGLGHTAAAASSEDDGDGGHGHTAIKDRLMSAAGVEHRTFNLLPQQMLEAVPGLTATNLDPILLKTQNLHELANMDEPELSALVGQETARQVVRFFRRCVFDIDGA